MNKLALVRRLARECRMTASATVPSTTLNQQGNLLDAVTWLDDAWNELQISNYWNWMRSRFSLSTVASTPSYAYGSFTDSIASAPITRFRDWFINDPDNPPRIYLTSAGIGTQGYLQYLPWELFCLMYRIGTIQESVPCHITVDPQKNIVLGPTPNDVYTVTGDYWKSPQVLAEDTDTPEMPDYLHMLIVYNAMMKYAGSESAAEIMARAEREGGPLRSMLNHEQRQRLRFGETHGVNMPALPNDRFEFVPAAGGCDFVTPPMLKKPGTLRECINFELGVNGGYDTIRGYERYDGRTSPSSATYTVLPADITGTVAVGNTVTGDTSTATGKVIAVEDEAIIVTQVTGTFEDGEDLTVSAAVQATMTGDPVTGGASTSLLNATYLNLAADVYRALIQAVPGSGQVRGVCRFDGVLYAWRDNVGATAMVIHKSTASGWSAITLGRELAFTSGGTTEITEGNTITGATSGATGVVARVILLSGTWAGGDAAGRLILSSQTGTFQSENLNIGASLNVATIAGNSSAITLSPGGRVKTVITNFGGQAATRRIYGCDGVNKGFEFDGTTYVPIHTGMSPDTPTNVAAHKSHLFFSFASSAQHSGTGEPHIWSPVFGAGEIAVGDTITGFSSEMGSEAGAALGILSRNKLHILYGNDDNDWNLIAYGEEVGAYANSIQNVGFTIMLDDRGVVSLRSTNAFGNFQNATLSALIQPWIQTRKSTIQDSCIVREKNQYRLFFGDESALYVTMQNSKVLGMMTQQLAHKACVVHSVEALAGGEEIFFGSDDGFVYQMEKGTSFDGAAIESFAMFEYANMGTPRLNKTFKGATVEATGSGYAVFSLGYELGYSSQYIHQPTSQATADDFESIVDFLESRWDIGNWDQGYWDGVSISPSNFKLVGTAENIAFILYVNSEMQEPIHFSGVMTRYLPRRILR